MNVVQHSSDALLGIYSGIGALRRPRLLFTTLYIVHCVNINVGTTTWTVNQLPLPPPRSHQ